MKVAALLATAVCLALSAPAIAAPSATETVHVVTSGETLNGIANRAGVEAEEIARANGLKPPYLVRIGQKLKIPRDETPSRPAAKAETAKASPPPKSGPSASTEQTESVHVVEAGETLGGIAQRARVPRVLIAEANGLAPPFVVKVGQKLRIPRTGHYEVQPGDTGFSIAMDKGVPWSDIAVANGMKEDDPVKVGQDLLIPTLIDQPRAAPSSTSTSAAPAPAPTPTPTASAKAREARFAWPIAGPVRRPFSSGSDRHDGIDITAPRGTMVRAAAAGTVVFAGKEKEQFGNLVVVDHGGGWYTAYGFLSRITVKKGTKVAAGERVGLVGDTGLAKGNELHFEVRKNGSPVDPLSELPPTG